MASYRITPTEAGLWRVDPDALGAWIATRWPGASRGGDGRGQRAYVWTLPASHEVWVPEDREVVWAEADAPTLAALAAWCEERSPQPLVLTDEAYAHPVSLPGLDTQAVVAALDRPSP